MSPRWIAVPFIGLVIATGLWTAWTVAQTGSALFGTLLMACAIMVVVGAVLWAGYATSTGRWWPR